MFKKIKTWLINLLVSIINRLSKLLAWLKKEKDLIEADIKRVKTIESQTLIDIDKTINNVVRKSISDLQDGDKFICHYCSKEFILLTKNIFPTSVRVLYKDCYTTGKGILCPHCGQTCITG